MTNKEYHFIDRRRVEGTVWEVSEIIENGKDLSRWCPSVYLEVEELAQTRYKSIVPEDKR